MMSTRHSVAPSLTQLYFYLTEGCNLACRHCWLAPKYDPEGDHTPSLPAELFETAIREAKALGLQRVKLTGGEPLLHPQIRTLLEIVRREGLGLVMETNGVLMTAGRLRKSTVWNMSRSEMHFSRVDAIATQTSTS